ncbi:MAG: endonuclease [Winogradskyella sp.]|uniref:endonuclease/exonuclease/phosphatase family protein n=1 Tax=Winogradskyella sp. TaxID=1883156 RepID=UPI0017BC7C00|nr:endonuclease/exonuclease/phosphatase family protein [Winogradskyella sp.]MBT8244342.1 endonuclease [Winogradskyella sp.]NNK22737.1 endonuclease [Winogradskyella sp.]
MSQKHTIAFYNIENLFDTKDDANTYDDDFLPHSAKRWTTKRYQNKLRKLGQVITQIGEDDVDSPPAIVGLAEVENKQVVQDLIEGKYLRHYNYDIVHYDSSDERGIDVALIYNTDVFEVSHSEPFAVYLTKEDGSRDYTRDVLLVSGRLNDEQTHIIVNHWSSRRQGEKETEHKRLAASDTVNRVVEVLNKNYDNPKIIVMGDFNDTPQNRSLISLEEKSNLYNPFKKISTRDKGSLNHNFEWHLFDQILISTNFFDATSTKFNLSEADIYNSQFLTQYHGKFKGQPFRTYVGKRYKGGYSDHFPVYIELKKDN